MLLLVGIVGCTQTYASKQQAAVACGEWKSEGEKLDFVMSYARASWLSEKEKLKRGDKPHTVNARDCDLEEDTNQYLGIQGRFTDYDKNRGNLPYDVNSYDQYPYPVDKKVVKNFRY